MNNIFNFVEERSVAKDECAKNAKDANKPTKQFSEVKTSEIVPEQSHKTTGGSNEDNHDIQSINVGPYNKSTSQTNESMKETDFNTSVQEQPTSFGRCIGKF